MLHPAEIRCTLIELPTCTILLPLCNSLKCLNAGLSGIGIRVPQSDTKMLWYWTEMLDAQIPMSASASMLMPIYDNIIAFASLKFLKILTDALLRISFSVIGLCSLVSNSHRLQGQCTRIYLSQALPVWFTESQAASCKHCQCQIAAIGL
jgi:hypothetical protein